MAFTGSHASTKDLGKDHSCNCYSHPDIAPAGYTIFPFLLGDLLPDAVQIGRHRQRIPHCALYQETAWRERLEKSAKPLAFAALISLVVANHFGFNRDSNSLLHNSLGFSMVALMSVGLLIWTNTSKGWLHAILTIRPLRFIGRISYMAYLIHLPMIVFMQEFGAAHGNPHGRQFAVISAPFTLLFATATQYLIERPILRWNDSQRNSQSPA